MYYFVYFDTLPSLGYLPRKIKEVVKKKMVKIRNIANMVDHLSNVSWCRIVFRLHTLDEINILRIFVLLELLMSFTFVFNGAS